MDGWKTTFFLLGFGLFSVDMLVSGKVLGFDFKQVSPQQVGKDDLVDEHLFNG